VVLHSHTWTCGASQPHMDMWCFTATHGHVVLHSPHMASYRNAIA